MKNEPRFAMYTVGAKGWTAKYEAKIKLPFNLTNLRVCLAKSIFLTMYKPLDTFIFVTLKEDAYDLLEKHKQVFDIIDDCQTIFAYNIKDIPSGIYTVGQVQIATEDLSYVGKSNFQNIDDLYYSEERKAVIREQLEKAAIIVEGMLQYKFHGKFTDECLALVDDYRAAEMLER
jgi:hypothetical protein